MRFDKGNTKTATLEKIFRKKDYIVVILLALYCTNFMSIGNYLPYLLIPYLFMYLLKNKFSRNFVITLSALLTFSILYSLTMYLYGFITIGTVIRYVVYPVGIYVFGYDLVKGDLFYKKTLVYLFAVILSFVTFGFLSLVKTLSLYGDMVTASQILGGRVVLNMWGSDVIAATLLNVSSSLGLSLCTIIFISEKHLPYRRMIKLLSFVCLVASTYAVLQLGNRTGLLIIVGSFIATSLFTRKFGPKKVVTFLLMFLVLLVLKNLFDNNFLGIKNDWESSFLFSRFNDGSLLDDPRIMAWKAAFFGMFEYPLGGKQTDLHLNYAHNLWLDVGYNAGILPFLFLLLFTVISFISLFTFRNRNHPVMLKCLFISLYTAFGITFFVEPIIEGHYIYFTVFVFITGIVQRLNYDFKQRKLIL